MQRKDKQRARGIANHYVKTGDLRRRPCAVCGERQVQMHHPSYSKPFEVIWLCKTHHWQLHKFLNSLNRDEREWESVMRNEDWRKLVELLSIK